ncbi:MAG: flagellar type III secretion system pore protein FliP [Myxococcota bacterium]
MTGNPWGVLAVLLVLAALHFGLRRFASARPGGGRRLRVVESCALGTRKQLHLVEVQGERLLIGASESGVSLLRRLPEAPVERAPEAPARRRWRLRTGAALLATVCFGLAVAVPWAASAQEASSPSLVLSLAGTDDPAEIAPALELLALLTVVSIAPSILLMMTCFTRVVIVLAFVRQAIGVQHLPPNQVLIGLALFVTLFVMAPLGEQIKVEAYDPYVAKEITLDEASERGLAPIRTFLLSHTRESDLDLFVSMSGAEELASLDDLPTATLLPAFLISELRTAFEIGFMVFLPFLVIDLVVSSMLISMGMIVLPPIVVALPFKIMLFVLADGWNLVLGSVVSSLRV